MSGLLHDFISSLESPDSWDNVNKVLADIQSTYPKSPFLATKIKDIKDLLEPSWSRISVSLRRCLRERLSKILDETRHKKLTVYQTTERLPTNLRIFDILASKNGFEGWNAPIPRSVLARLRTRIRGRYWSRFASFGRSIQKSLDDWDDCTAEKQCQVLVKLLEFEDEVLRAQASNKEHSANTKLPEAPTPEELLASTVSLAPLGDRPHRSFAPAPTPGRSSSRAHERTSPVQPGHVSALDAVTLAPFLLPGTIVRPSGAVQMSPFTASQRRPGEHQHIIDPHRMPSAPHPHTSDFGHALQDPAQQHYPALPFDPNHVDYNFSGSQSFASSPHFGGFANAPFEHARHPSLMPAGEPAQPHHLGQPYFPLAPSGQHPRFSFDPNNVDFSIPPPGGLNGILSTPLPLRPSQPSGGFSHALSGNFPPHAGSPPGPHEPYHSEPPFPPDPYPYNPYF
ncbi:hypothetical protein JCM3766R1_003444 [Sporobolomyces carnicolor]